MIRIKDGFKGAKSYVLPPATISALERHPLSAILHITDIGYYPRASNHYRERTTPLNQYVFIYCVAGSGWYEVEGTRYDVNDDTYFILPAGKPHSYGSSQDNPWTIYWIHFSGSLAGEYLPGTSMPITIKPGVRSRIAGRIEIFEEIMTTLDNGLDLEHLLYAYSVFHHFLGSLRFLSQYRAVGAQKNDTLDITESAIHFMKENIGKQLRLSQIASYVGFSPSHFSAKFYKDTGQSPIDYFNRLKIEYACRLLEGSGEHINNICHKVGIPDPYYFSRVFKRFTGMSPTDYRTRRSEI